MNRTGMLLIACLMPPLCGAADVAPIGRLMFTPAERTVIDKYREKGEDNVEVSVTPASIIPQEKEPPAEQVTLDGFVKRSNGKSTTWVNGIPQQEREVSQGIRVLQQRAKAPVISIQLSSGKRLELKPGQTFDAGSNRVIEVYENLPAPSPATSTK